MRHARSRNPHSPLLEPLEPRTLLSVATASALVFAQGDSATAYIVAANHGPVTGTVTFTIVNDIVATVAVTNVRVGNAFVGVASAILRLPDGLGPLAASYSGDATFASSHATTQTRVLPAEVVTLGAAAGQHGFIHAVDVHNAAVRTLRPFGNFNGAINVAAGDVNFDFFPDLIVAVGSGGPPLVQVIDFHTGLVEKSFLAFDASFTGGVNVAVGDLNGDGHADIIVGMASGGSQVREFSGADGSLLATLNPFGTFTGGVRVASDTSDNDSPSDIAVATGPGADIFKVFLAGSTTSAMTQNFGDGQHQGGYIALGDFDHNLADGNEVFVNAGANALPAVQIFSIDQRALITRFNAYSNVNQSTSGVYLAIGDLNHDNFDDYITNLVGTNLIAVIDGATHTINRPLTNFFAGYDVPGAGLPVSIYDAPIGTA